MGWFNWGKGDDDQDPIDKLREQARRDRERDEKIWQEKQEYLAKVQREIAERIWRDEQEKMRQEQRYQDWRRGQEQQRQWHEEQARMRRGPGPMRR